MMSKSSLLVTILAAGTAVCVAPSAAEESKDPAALLDRMADAHGGAGNWLAAPAIRLRLTMHLTSLQPSETRTRSDSWRYYETVVDPDTSRAYVDIPHENQDGFEAGFDGKKLWRTDYSFDPSFQDGALMLSWYHYGMIALPFIAKAEGAKLEYLGAEALPGHERSHDKVRIDFAPAGWSGEITLYIDQETGLLRGWDQGAMFPPLPGEPLPGVPTPPASPLRVADSYFEVGGFTLPRAYVTYNPAHEPGGYHFVLDAEVLDKFEADKAAAPAAAQISFEKS